MLDKRLVMSGNGGLKLFMNAFIYFSSKTSSTLCRWIFIDCVKVVRLENEMDLNIFC